MTYHSGFLWDILTFARETTAVSQNVGKQMPCGAAAYSRRMNTIVRSESRCALIKVV
jgi:hypothetical protein